MGAMREGHSAGIRKKSEAARAPGCFTYIAHLEDMGLVKGGWDVAGKLHFQITARGMERLQWLRSQDSTTTTIRELIEPFLRG